MDELMNDEELANSDKLESYFKDKILVHIILKRKLSDGKNIFLNGLLLGKITERVWVLEERVLGEIRISISEICSNGVSEMKKVRE